MLESGHDIIIADMEYGDSKSGTSIDRCDSGFPAWVAAPSHSKPCVTIATSKAWQWLGVSSLLLFIAAIWTVVKPYLGLVHDARLYALQTAAKLKPDVFSGDLFLRFGSQDNFTVFPWVYAPLGRILGLEYAAAVLTFFFATAWLTLGFLIAREISGTRLALLALGLLVVAPSWYGGYEVFQIGEMFLSARLPAEVFALGALLAHVRRKYFAAFALCIGSALIHPLMAIPIIGVLMLTTMRERFGSRAAHISLGATFAAAILLSATIPIASIEPSEDWLSILRARSPFLFPDDWRTADWQVHVLTWVTLVIGSRVLIDPSSRNLAACAAWVGLAGVGLAMVASAWPEHTALLMAQPWRWMWVPRFLSVIILPLVVCTLWRPGPNCSRRTASLFLVSAWLLESSIGGFIGLMAYVAIAMHDRFRPGLRRAMQAGAVAVLLASVISAGATAIQFAGYSLNNSPDPIWVQSAMRFFGETPSAALAITAGWAVIVLGRSRIGFAVFAVIAIIAATVAAPPAVRNWSTTNYSATAFGAFSPWRETIPQNAEVLWLWDPLATWLLLERRSYVSFDQLAGVLYSPRMLPELRRRTRALTALASPDWWTGADGRLQAKPRDLTAEILDRICAAPGLDYVVSDRDIGGAVSQIQWPFWEIDYYLYDCRTFTAAGAKLESLDT